MMHIDSCRAASWQPTTTPGGIYIKINKARQSEVHYHLCPRWRIAEQQVRISTENPGCNSLVLLQPLSALWISYPSQETYISPRVATCQTSLIQSSFPPRVVDSSAQKHLVVVLRPSCPYTAISHPHLPPRLVHTHTCQNPYRSSSHRFT